MEDRVEFIKNAILGERVGAISRSSRYVVKRVLKEIGQGTLLNVVEYGPGDGVLTRELLKILDPKGKILVVEIDSNFINILRKINDPRVIVVEGKMQDVSSSLSKYGFDKVDLVLSSVPFSLINNEDKNTVVKNSFDSLKDGGKLIIFHQYSTLMTKYFKKYFSNIEIQFELRNVFPCFILSAKK